jgi:hypothetical protein
MMSHLESHHSVRDVMLRRIQLERLSLKIAALEKSSPRQILPRVSLDWLSEFGPSLLFEKAALNDVSVLRQVPGLGPRRIRSHGEEILACLRTLARDGHGPEAYSKSHRLL